MKKSLPFFLAVFLGPSLLNAVQPNTVPKLELPLILDSERALLLGGRSDSKGRFSEWKLYTRLPTHNYEPVGLHLDTNPRNHYEPDGNDGFRDVSGKGRGLFPAYELASNIAWLSRRNVLVSARVEKRGYERVAMTGTPDQKINRLRRHLEKNGVETRLLGDDTFVLFESPQDEKAFTYDRTRAVQYEKEREAWLVRNEDYTAQGLIYQPTPAGAADSGAPPLPEREIRVRHAAAWLAKTMQKEVFVQAAIEKRDFKFPKPDDTARLSYSERMLRQINHASVKIVELSPRAIALTD